MFESILCQVTDHDPDILESLIGLAVEIAREGREGRRVGTLFTLGDENAVLARSRPLILDPLVGHPEPSRHLTNLNLRGTIKELAQLDGGFVVSRQGIVLSACRPDVNIPNLLKPATMQKVQNTANIASAAASKMGARVRMTEGNTCYRGGKPGVSDVFAAALWSADYSLLLASNDYSGVNLHGGTGKSVANSVGGSLPGDALLEAKGETPEQIAAHPHPFYTAIATFSSDYVLEPVAYGLKFAGSFSGGTLLKTEFSTKLQDAGVNATAYAAKLPGGHTSVIILNKDAAEDLEVELDFGRDASGVVQTETLHAPAPDSREAHITTSTKSESLKQGKCAVTVPRGTGLRMTVV